MSTLVLELKQGELLIINGAPIRFKTRSRIELAGQARFLFGKQILTPAEANTPARRIYFALQAVYVGSDEERAAALVSAYSLIEAFKAATTSALAREILDRAMTLAREGAFYEALKLARRIIRHESAVFEKASASAALHDGPGPSGALGENKADEIRTDEIRTDEISAGELRTGELKKEASA